MTNDPYSQIVQKLKVVLLIPTYNHAGFLEAVLMDCKPYPISIIVVNDGSTDDTFTIIERFAKRDDLLGPFYKIHFPKNRGKGAAIKAGAKYAQQLGFESVITMDSDGQHFPSDIIHFLEKAIQDPKQIIIGTRGFDHDNMPKQNTTANKISNFWFRFQTSKNLPDTQSGFRYYPLACFRKMIWLTDRYNFELEVMVRNIWRGFQISEIPIQIYYPPIDVRVSHFRPTVDFMRITLLNTLLSILAVLYYYPKSTILSLFNKNKHK